MNEIQRYQYTHVSNTHKPWRWLSGLERLIQQRDVGYSNPSLDRLSRKKKNQVVTDALQDARQ